MSWTLRMMMTDRGPTFLEEWSHALGACWPCSDGDTRPFRAAEAEIEGIYYKTLKMCWEKCLLVRRCISLRSRLHTCPEGLIQLGELIKRSVNGFLVQFGHILGICKFWNPEQREKRNISLFVKFGGEKRGFGPLFGFGLDWNLFSSENVCILSHLDINIWSIGWNISILNLPKYFNFWKIRGFFI